jgi:hypothetical protein
MKNIADVLRAKEEEILRVKAEVTALRIVAPLLGHEEPKNGTNRPAGPRAVEDLP